MPIKKGLVSYDSIQTLLISFYPLIIPQKTLQFCMQHYIIAFGTLDFWPKSSLALAVSLNVLLEALGARFSALSQWEEEVSMTLLE